MLFNRTVTLAAFSCIFGTLVASAAPFYLNDSNISVALGAGMAAEPFANRTTAASLASIIDAPTAASGEFHNQSTHVWVDGGILTLRFDFGTEYDLTQMHFWNYHSEGFDVDDVDFTFFNAANVSVGTLLNVAPALGNGTNSDGTLIFAETLALSFPQRVRFVDVTLSGNNNQVDFNNIGFTGEVTDAVPEPGTMGLVAGGLILIAYRRRSTR